MIYIILCNHIESHNLYLKYPNSYIFTADRGSDRKNPMTALKSYKMYMARQINKNVMS